MLIISDKNIYGEVEKQMERIDFTNCRRILGKAYNGANGKKIAVEYEGVVYMLKFPPSAENKPTDLSYTNSCFSEHIASSIFRMLGISAQETLLGTFQVAGKTKVVCACKDFTSDGKILYDFCSIKNTILDSDHGGTGTELSDIMESIFGMCLWWMRFLAILTGIMGTGDFYMIRFPKTQKLRRYLTVGAACCPRQMRLLWNGCCGMRMR